MNRYFSYLNTAVRVIDSYKGTVPLKHFLKQYFAGDKKYGSRDRKLIGHLCYCYYRLGHSLKDLQRDERIKTGLFLCTGAPAEWGGLYTQDWLDAWHPEIGHRIAFVSEQYPDFTGAAVFPWPKALPADIDPQAFAYSHLIQPDLFLRIRPGKRETVTAKLIEAGISYSEYDEGGLCLPNSSKIDIVLETDKEVVVQDINSQRVGAFMGLGHISEVSGRTSDRIPAETGWPGQGAKSHSSIRPAGMPVIWDCCAASGGKSILAYDIIGKMLLEVSDNRPSIINNLRERFKRAGIKHYSTFIADLGSPAFKPPPSAYDLIIADVPCSGSGTWSRTPEQLYFFETGKISVYASLQKKIISNIIAALKPGGVLLYITCSVFREENEEIVKFIQKEGDLTVDKAEYLAGYTGKADTLFVARLVKSRLK